MPKIPESTERNCSIQNVTQPETGLTLQCREWYEPKEGKLYATFTLMWGVGVGNPAALKRIIDSA